MTQSEFAVHPVGSGRSFTAYVFVKRDKAQHAQRASLADASAAQPLSPQALAAQKIIAESPSPITTPHIAAASRPCQMPSYSKAASAVTISVDATAGVAEATVCTDTCTDRAEACVTTDQSCDGYELEPSFDLRGAKAGDQHSCGEYGDAAHCFPVSMCRVLRCSKVIDIHTCLWLTVLHCYERKRKEKKRKEKKRKEKKRKEKKKKRLCC